MPNLARMAGRALGWFLVFDVLGVLLSLLAELAAALSIVLEASSLLGYAVWFVVGVFCAAVIYMGTVEEVGPDTDEGRRQGLLVIWVTAVVAGMLAALSSLVWSSSEGTEAVAPDHRGVTITYLVTTVLALAFARFVVFREQANVAKTPRPAQPRDDSRRYLRALERMSAADTPQREKKGAASKLGWILKALGFAIGVPVLLFLDASFFLFAPFDYFDRWMDGILTTALLSGLAWGIACAWSASAREWLMVVHAPLLIGTVFYFFAILLGGILFAIGVPEGALEVLGYLGFGLGFLLGGVLPVVQIAEVFQRRTQKSEAHQ